MSLHLNIEFKLSQCNYILLRGNQFHSTSDIETGSTSMSMKKA